MKGSSQNQEQQQLIVRANNNNNVDSRTNINNINNINTRDKRVTGSSSPAVSQRDLRASSVQRQSDTIRSVFSSSGPSLSPKSQRQGIPDGDWTS